MRLSLPQRVDVGWLEAQASELAAGTAGGALVIDIGAVERFELLAETRLLGVLAGARRRGLDVRLEHSRPIDLDRGEPERLVKLFRDTLAGVILAQLAHQVVDGTGGERGPQIRALQAETAVRRDGAFGFGLEWAIPMVDLFGGPPPGSLVRRGDTSFEALFRDRVSGFNLGDLVDLQLADLSSFAYETFDNTRMHGVWSVDRRPLEGIRYIAMRVLRVRRDGLRAVADRIMYAPLSTYLADLADAHSGVPELPVVELTVADSGVGIAATMAGSEDIYAEPFEREAERFSAAFEKGRTSRRASGVGQGLPKVLRAAESVDALLAVRSGRAHHHRNFLAGGEPQTEESALIAGTSVSLIFPWQPQRQLALDL